MTYCGSRVLSPLITAEGKCQQEEIAEREARQKAHSQRAGTKQERLKRSC